MHYFTFSTIANPTPRLGAMLGDHVVDARAVAAAQWDGPPPATLLQLIQQGPGAWQRLRDLLDGSTPRTMHAASEIRWHAPIPRPLKNVICLGQNYAAHAREGAIARGQEPRLPEHPVFFSKLPTAVNGPFDDIRVDTTVTRTVDWEAELGVIIGLAGRDIRRADALGHVFGYTVINDVTARDLQARHGQSFKGKSLDGFCPMGPVVVTADEITDPHDLAISLTVNGVTKQHSTTSDMIFRIDAIIETFSQGITLEPGDIISTGTPEGVGFGRTPQEFLHDGDVIETTVERIGTLRNRVVESEHRVA